MVIRECSRSQIGEQLDEESSSGFVGGPDGIRTRDWGTNPIFLIIRLFCQSISKDQTE
jgi:hypothetical protein